MASASVFAFLTPFDSVSVCGLECLTSTRQRRRATRGTRSTGGHGRRARRRRRIRVKVPVMLGVIVVVSLGV